MTGRLREYRSGRVFGPLLPVMIRGFAQIFNSIHGIFGRT